MASIVVNVSTDSDCAKANSGRIVADSPGTMLKAGDRVGYRKSDCCDQHVESEN
jgi:hypothetical protein